jgi:hypothetical protein
VSDGYIPEEIRARVRSQAGERCGYCLSPQWLVLGRLEIEHIIPRAAGGSDEEDNLWQSCRMCNGFKGAQTQAFDPVTGQWVRLFDPRRQRWSEHFAWSEDGTQILGQTSCGRATSIALQLNNLIAGWYGGPGSQPVGIRRRRTRPTPTSQARSDFPDAGALGHGQFAFRLVELEDVRGEGVGRFQLFFLQFLAL